MNKKVTKIISICLCAALCLGCAGVAFAQTGSKQESAQPTAAQKAAAGEYSFDIGEALRIMEQNTGEG